MRRPIFICIALLRRQKLNTSIYILELKLINHLMGNVMLLGCDEPDGFDSRNCGWDNQDDCEDMNCCWNPNSEGPYDCYHPLGNNSRYKYNHADQGGISIR
jgi:hypothetical protein